MDPISAMLLALALAGVTVKTGASGIADAAASTKGHTPPSVQKWHARQKQRQQRGQKPETDPGPWTRRWRNAAEARTEKAGQKHAARMEHLRENADTTKQNHKDRLAKRAARRDQVGTTLAGWGHTSWAATKQAATQARDARAERRAWKENTRRDAEPDQPGPDTEDTPDGPGADGEGQDAAVLPSPRPAADQPDPELAPTCDWRETFPSRPCGRPREGDHGLCPQHRRAQLREREREDAPDTHNPQDTDNSDDSDTTDNTDENSGGIPVSSPTHSGEITDLPSAIAYFADSVEYCGNISGTFEESQSQAATSVEDLEAQLAALEAAQSSLASQGMTGDIQQHLSGMAEQFSSLVSNLRQVQELLSATHEAIASARQAADSAHDELTAQSGIAEQVQSHGDNVADNTEFYANA